VLSRSARTLPTSHAELEVAPVNIDYVYGFSDIAAQTFMPGWAWLIFLLVAMPLLIFIPTHFCLRKLSPVPVISMKAHE
jgi:hypothetical protein